jgi:hypothetical protein
MANHSVKPVLTFSFVSKSFHSSAQETRKYATLCYDAVEVENYGCEHNIVYGCKHIIVNTRNMVNL